MHGNANAWNGRVQADTKILDKDMYNRSYKMKKISNFTLKFIMHNRQKNEFIYIKTLSFSSHKIFSYY